MAKHQSFHVRTYAADGGLRAGSTCYELTRAVELLAAATGCPWSYQVIHRALKAGPLWASAFVAADGGSFICSIEAVPLGAPVKDVRIHEEGRTARLTSRPIEVPVAAAAADAEQLVCHQCKQVHSFIPGNCGLCAQCMDGVPALVPAAELVPAPAASAPKIIASDKKHIDVFSARTFSDYRCAGNSHKLPCDRLSKWQAKQYGCTCGKKPAPVDVKLADSATIGMPPLF